MSVPLPEDEHDRLRVLKDLRILDTDPEEAFDELADLTREIFQVEKSAVSFVGQERQWFKAACGWDVQETPRSQAFCSHAILDSEVMVVENAAEDPRFADNPLVTAEEGLRFYAGAPVSVEEGRRVGTLCIADSRPREFSDRERRLLRRLAGRVERELDLRSEAHRLSYLTSAVEEAGEIVLITEAEPLSDPGPRIVYVNPVFTEITGYEREEAIGRTPRILQGPETSRETLEEVRSALEAREPIDVELLNYTKSGESYWLQMSIAPVYDESGTCTHFVGIERDVSARKQRERQIHVLNRILQHDLRRDVGTVRGWADLIAEEDEAETEQKARRIVQGADHMIETLTASGVVLDALMEGKPMSVQPTELGPILDRAVEVAGLRFPEAVFAVDRPSDLPVVQANELLESVFENLLANAVRHHDRESPHVEVQVQVREETLTVAVVDDGPGIPEDQREQLFVEGHRGLDSSGMGLGLYLVDTLVSEYGGAVAVSENEPRGTRFAVHLRKAEASPDTVV